MRVTVTKLTDVELLHKANSFTTGKESHMSLARAYASGHTTIRTQMFTVECYDIPQFVAYHLRTHFTLYPMPPFEYGRMKSKRVDRGGADFRSECEALVDILETQIENIEDSSFPYMIGAVISNIRGAIDIIKGMPNRFDRFAPTNFSFIISAEGLITMANKRLCVASVSPETREVVQQIINAASVVDTDLAKHCVKPCVATGICREAKSCGFIKSDLYRRQRNDYKLLFA